MGAKRVWRFSTIRKTRFNDETTASKKLADAKNDAVAVSRKAALALQAAKAAEATKPTVKTSVAVVKKKKRFGPQTISKRAGWRRRVFKSAHAASVEGRSNLGESRAKSRYLFNVAKCAANTAIARLMEKLTGSKRRYHTST